MRPTKSQRADAAGRRNLRRHDRDGIMEKERVSPTRFELSISGELDTETVQSSSVFKSFRIVYNVQCECENDQMKVSRAINLAHDKHCGGVQMLRKIAPVADEIAIVNTK